MQVKLTMGERLKDLRTAQKLTLEQLAAEVGISKSALGKYESDNGKDISRTAFCCRRTITVFPATI